MKAFYLIVIATCTCGFIACQELSINYSIRSIAAEAGVCPDTQDHVENIRQGIDSLIDSVLPVFSRCGACGGSGWRRAAYLNISDPTQTCPPAWELITTPKRSRARPSSAGSYSQLSHGILLL